MGTKAQLIKASTLSTPSIPSDVRKFMDNAKSYSTHRTYLASWRDFQEYCRHKKIQALPARPGDIVQYLSFCADGGLKVSTLSVRLAAISMIHRLNNLPDPTRDESIRMIMAGIRRTVGVRPCQKEALLFDGLKRIVSMIPNDLRGLRDKALLLLAWATASRRSEIIQLDFDDLKITQTGLTIIVRRSKTDQEGKGDEKHIPHIRLEDICPVCILLKWLDRAKIKNGAVFRKVDRWGKVSKKRLTPQVVALIVKKYARASGFDPVNYSGHSLRAGAVTQASLNGCDILSIRELTHHQSLDTLARYQRSAGVMARKVVKNIFEDE